MNVSNFVNTVSQRGLLRNNRFIVSVPIPKGIRDNTDFTQKYSQLERDLELYCEAASLPGIGLMTSQIRRQGFGPWEKRPYAPNFLDQRLTFLSDEEGIIWDFFKTWIQLIMNFNSTKVGAFGVKPGQANYEFTYPADYQVDLKISVYDMQNRKRIVVTLLEAFPVSTANINLSWGDQNSIMKLPIEFTYRDWFTEESDLTESEYKRYIEILNRTLRGNGNGSAQNQTSTLRA